MHVSFTYLDFDGIEKESTATIVEEDNEWFYAKNLGMWGCGKKVSSVICWHPINAALQALMGGRTIITWNSLE